MSNSRREFLKQSLSLAALSATGISINKAECNETIEQVDWPITEGPETPKIALLGSTNPDESEIRRLKQIGVNTVVVWGVQIPWSKEDLLTFVEPYEEAGIKVYDKPIGGFEKAIRGEQGRDKQIDDVKESIRVAGELGIPLVEYNWYAHRLTEGYYGIKGRGGAGYTAFDYSKVKDLPPKEGTKPMDAEELWDNYAYFLEEIIPVAEEAGVDMAVHPNDPPTPKSRGSDQILTTFNDFKRLTNLVDSPRNGMTCHPGYYKELGIDGLEVIRYLGERDRINLVHFRNVRLQVPYKKYIEVFPDNGDADMWALMREVVRQGYTGAIKNDHARALDYDREHKGGIESGYADVGGGGYAGDVYNVGYSRAMLQAALIVEGKVQKVKNKK